LKHKIGIIGCGWVAPFHVNALTNLRDRASVVWVADPAGERTELIARQVIDSGLAYDGSPRQLADFHNGLAEADSVFVLLPHHLHCQASVDCLEAGCNVLLEKPLAVSLEEAGRMIAASDSTRRLLMVAYPHRYRKSTQAFKRFIESGEFGKLILLDAMMDENLRGYTDLGWIRAKRTLGGGVFFSSSPHMLDVMFWIGGEVRTMSMVGAYGGVPMEGETTAVSIMKFENGVIGTTRHTWVSPDPKVWYTMRAVCEKAVITLTANPEGDLVTEGHRCKWRSRITASPDDRVLLENDEGLDFTGEISHFFDCLDTGKPCETDARAGRKVMEIIFSAYEKAAAAGGN
jgi:UDP-N-acetyl-2-amino-2-deoxyglucuronate dehydrogenase